MHADMHVHSDMEYLYWLIVICRLNALGLMVVFLQVFLVVAV